MFTGTPTQKLGLPQYNPNDHPDFLTEINEAFRKIDSFTLEIVQQNETLSAKVSILEAELAKLKIDCGLTNSAERED